MKIKLPYLNLIIGFVLLCIVLIMIFTAKSTSDPLPDPSAVQITASRTEASSLASSSPIQQDQTISKHQSQLDIPTPMDDQEQIMQTTQAFLHKMLHADPSDTAHSPQARFDSFSAYLSEHAKKQMKPEHPESPEDTAVQSQLIACKVFTDIPDNRKASALVLTYTKTQVEELPATSDTNIYRIHFVYEKDAWKVDQIALGQSFKFQIPTDQLFS